MNDDQKTDGVLRQSLAEALGLPPLSDSAIERLAPDSDDAVIDDRRLGRVLSNARSMIAESEAGARMQPETDPMPAQTDHSGPSLRIQKTPRRNGNSRGAVTALVISAISLFGVLLMTSQESVRYEVQLAKQEQQQRENLAGIRRHWMTASTRPVVSSHRVEVGDVVSTGPRERRRVVLPDGSILFVNVSTQATVVTDRRVDVERGEVFVEVMPQFDEGSQRKLFTVVTPRRTVTALGTKFGVDTSDDATDVLVTQGKVKVSGVAEVVESGQRVGAKRKAADGTPVEVVAAQRASEHLSWTRDLMVAAAGALVPVSKHAGGSIISIDPNGQEMKLSLRKYHVDVHIEDGFARTTIDQTYFNHTHRRLEGTFHFPLPPDASLSRLAMYVNGKLMEGGMAERQHARNTFEKIVHKMKDPALLEWVDGSTFKMRVFPLEARQEKRIVLSYTQRLNSAYGKTYYRFPAGHSMDTVKEWSSSVRLKNGVARNWTSPSHHFNAGIDGKDLVLKASEQNSRMDHDVVIELAGTSRETVEGDQVAARWSRVVHDGYQYAMLRYRPNLPGRMQRPPRHWVFLFEASADRNPLLARTQIEVIRVLLDNAEHSDTFNIVTANTEAIGFGEEPLECSAKNIANAIETLNQTHLIGALDLQKALRVCGELSVDDRETLVVQTGSAIPVLGEQDQSALLKSLSANAEYVGVGVGKRWSRPLMKAAASQSGGYFTQINPDEDVAWRAFELSSLLNTPRLLEVEVKRRAESGKRKESGAAEVSQFLNFADTIVHGEEICAVLRLDADEVLPQSVVVSGG